MKRAALITIHPLPPGIRNGGWGMAVMHATGKKTERRDGQPQPPVWETWTRVPQGGPWRVRLFLVETRLASLGKVGVDEIYLSQRWGRWATPYVQPRSRTITNVIH